MINKILIIAVNNDDYIGGNLIDCIDLYYNIRNYITTDLIILTEKHKIKLLYKKFKSTFSIYNDIISHIYLYNYKIPFDKYDLIIYRYNYYKFNQNILNYKGLMISGWSFIRDIINKRVNPNQFNILCSPFIKQFTNTQYFTYYMKLSEYRLNNIIMKNTNKVFTNYNIYEKLKSDNNFNIHEYDKIEYIRHLVDDNNLYMEMKGKLIFEFLYFNKKVHYSPINKLFNDGLTDYLNLFGIDDNIEQDLNISKEKIYNKLIKFNEKDKLFEIINKI